MIRKLRLVALIGVICLLAVTSALAYNESPMMRVKVATGELPPIEKRLPEVPYIKETLEEIGQYGGTLRCVRPSPDRDADIALNNAQPILQSPVELIAPGKYKGNVIESCEASEGFKVFTLRLRKGMKWSDGYPLTSEDFVFTYEDVLLNEKITPVFPRALTVGGEPMKLEAIDDYTVRISFTEPYGAFVYHIGFWMWAYPAMLKPKHYLKQFHPSYTPMEELEPLIKEEALPEGEWWTLLLRKDAWETVGQPTLEPWVVVKKRVGEYEYERNPFYFKVDPAGNQLPYIDKLRSTLVENPQMSVMKTIAGELDYVHQTVNVVDVPLLKEQEKKGGYRVQIFVNDVIWVFTLNLSHSDPVWCQVVGDVRFRRALNMAINRQEILDSQCLGMGEFPELTPSGYDPEKANQLLDEMGLVKRDNEGWRLGPDGKRFIIPLEVAPLWGYEGPVSELLIEYFKAIGIYTTTKTLEFGLWMTLGQSNEIKASTHWANEPSWRRNPVAYSEYLPDQFRSWGPAWRDWYNSGGTEGQEPPNEVKSMFELRDVILQTVSEEERANAIDEIIRSYYDNIWMMGLAWAPNIAVFATNVRNVPSGGIAYLIYLWADQYFFKG